MNKLRNILVAFLILSPAFALAQVVPDPVQYTVYPETPGPNEQVSIEAQGVGGFLGNANVTWSQDGKTVKSGVGESTYTFTTGALGKQTTIHVSISSPTQGDFSQTFRISPSLVNLVWEADTTVPPLFKGKALYSPGSPLRVVAFPVVYSGSNRVASNALSYKWSLDGEPAVAQSGLGRSSIVFNGDELNQTETVSVDVYYGPSLVAHGDISIPATTPSIVLYERDPLRGTLYDTAFPSLINLLGKEITLQAQPFYFARPDLANGSITYSWQLNGEDITGPDTASGILTLRQTGSGAGGAQVSVGLQSYATDTFVQQANAALHILFGGTNNNL